MRRGRLLPAAPPPRKNFLFEVIEDVGSQLLDVVLVDVGTRVLVPFVGGEAVGYALAVLGVAVELNQAGYAVVAYVSPCCQNERVGGNLEVADNVGIGTAAVDVAVP